MIDENMSKNCWNIIKINYAYSIIGSYHTILLEDLIIELNMLKFWTKTKSSFTSISVASLFPFIWQQNWSPTSSHKLYKP